MTEIDRRSWHYRWAIFSHSTEPDDLCTYVRSVVQTSLGFVLIGGFLGLVAAVILIVLLVIVEAIVQQPLITLFILLVVLLAVAVVVGLRSGPSIAGAGSKGIYAVHREAKRLGICPFIEYHS